MLRRGLAALMAGVVCAGSAIAEDPATTRPDPAPTPSGLTGWLKKTTSDLRGSKLTSGPKVRSGAGTGPGQTADSGGIQRAVINDAERQAVSVRHTSGDPEDLDVDFLDADEAKNAPIESILQPIPIEQAPVLPNLSAVSGPQYFSATGPGMSNPLPVTPSHNWQTYQQPRPVEVVSQGQYWYPGNANAPAGPAFYGQGQMTPLSHGITAPSGGMLYPQTGAALYPAAVPGIPQQVGGTVIHNQALHPHEMLYAHQYHALYPPYYYKVNGGWMVTPFGVWSHEDWKLQGTKVDVKYKSHVSPFTLWHPPVNR